MEDARDGMGEREHFPSQICNMDSPREDAHSHGRFAPDGGMRRTVRETQTTRRSIERIPVPGFKWTRHVEDRVCLRRDNRRGGEICVIQHQYKQFSIRGAAKTKAALGVGDVNAAVVATKLIHELELQRETILGPGKLRACCRIDHWRFKDPFGAQHTRIVIESLCALACYLYEDYDLDMIGCMHYL